MLITKTAGNVSFLYVSVLPLGIMNPLHVSLHVHMDAIIKTRAFVHPMMDGDRSKKTEQWYQYLRNDIKMPTPMEL